MDNLPLEKRLKKLVLSSQVKEKAGRGTSPLCKYVQGLSMETLCFLN